MCLAPVIIKNPYCGCDPSKGYNYLHDCVSTHIAVPCGHCKDCITTRQSAFAFRQYIYNREREIFYASQNQKNYRSV
jgi:hypothetical protein